MVFNWNFDLFSFLVSVRNKMFCNGIKVIEGKVGLRLKCFCLNWRNFNIKLIVLGIIFLYLVLEIYRSLWNCGLRELEYIFKWNLELVVLFILYWFCNYEKYESYVG